MDHLRIGMVGLDTSHCESFAKLLNGLDGDLRVSRGTITMGYPGGSDMAPSTSRVVRFTELLRDQYGVEIVDSLETLAQSTDAILLTSVDGRVHLEQFRQLAPYGKPIFVDKPLAVTLQDAEEMMRLAEGYDVPLMTCSMLRYAEAFVQALEDDADGRLIGVDCYGPLQLQEEAPGLFWYGIHGIEMLYRAYGKGCSYLTATTEDDHEVITAVWGDGRIGTYRGNREGNKSFGTLVHRERGTSFSDAAKGRHPMDYHLMQSIMTFFQSRTSPIDPEESLEIIRFIEAANLSRHTGERVWLNQGKGGLVNR